MKKPMTRSEPASKGMLSPLLEVFGNSLGEHLVGLINYLQSADQGELRDVLRAGRFALTLNINGARDAAITVTVDLDDGHGTQRREEIIYRSKPGKPVAVGLQRQVTIPFSVFEMMADLWSDTLAHRERKAALPPPKLRYRSKDAA